MPFLHEIIFQSKHIIYLYIIDSLNSSKLSHKINNIFHLALHKKTIQLSKNRFLKHL